MDVKYFVRKAQIGKRGSVIVTIPVQLARELGLDEDPYLKFAISNKTLLVKPAGSKFTKKDFTDVEKGASAGPAEPEEDDEFAKIMEDTRKNVKDNRSRLEKLKMK